MQLYPHQEKFLSDNPNKALLAFDTGTGKTISSILWSEKECRKYTNFLIIVPKNIKEKWKRDVEGKVNMQIVTKEEFKSYKPDPKLTYSLIVDEADFFGSPLFTKGRSQMAGKLYNFIRDKNVQHILLLTATPFRNAPHTIHTLLSYIGSAMPWKEWQWATYDLKKLPYLPAPAFIPKKYWRQYAVQYAKPKMYTAKISDLVTVPTQHDEVITIPTVRPAYIAAENPTAEWHAYARLESGKEKLDWIKAYIRGKSKVVIVCRYKEQIAHYKKELEKEREVFVLTGDVKNQDAVIQEAKDSFECVFLIQASVGAGFELPDFSYMIFASLSFSHRDYIQMKGRILRINALKENWYTILNGGKCDKSVYDRIMLGEDFSL